MNKLPDPAFELVISEWKMPDSAGSTVPATNTKRGLENNTENEEPPRQKPKLCLSLKKGAKAMI